MAVACHCSACDSDFKVRDEMAGKLGKCPRCGEVFRVPGEASSSSGIGSSAAGSVVRNTSVAAESMPQVRSAAAGPTAAGLATASSAARPGRKPSRVAGRFAEKHGRLSSPPLWAWIGGAVALIAVSVGVIVALNGDDKPVAQNSPNTPARPATDVGAGPVDDAFSGALKTPKAEVVDPYAPGLVPTKPKKEETRVEKPKPGASLDEFARYAEYAIVKLDVYSDDFNQTDSLGSGFIIDVEERLVVTNYHVLQTAVKAGVKFNNGVRYGVLGYVAIKKESDLAIIQLNGLPPQATELEMKIDGDPAKDDPVVSIGHPHGHEFRVTRGNVEMVKMTKDLPQDEQDFLHDGTHNSAADEVWIKHSAEINPGNSGGPVFNAHGEVLGVNTWKRTDETSGYALHAKHVAALLKQRFPEPQPLRKYFQPRQQGGVQLQPAHLKRAFDEAVAMDWTPKSEQDFAKISRFAFLLTLTKRVAESDDPVPDKDKWRQQVDGVVEALRTTQWKPEQFQALNQFAAAVEYDPGQGTMFQGSVQRVFQKEHEGQRMQLMQIGIEGSNKFVFVPVPEKTEAVPENTRVLVAGFALGFLGVGDNPLQQTEVPIVNSLSIFKLP